jgi:hypothetical protein
VKARFPRLFLVNPKTYGHLQKCHSCESRNPEKQTLDAASSAA